MRIVHCLNQYMPRVLAGTEVYTHTLATMQKSSGHEVAVVTPHINHHRPGQIVEHYLYDSIDVYQYLETADPGDRQIHYGKKKPAGLENFKQLILKLKPQVIHFHELNRSIGLTAEHVKIAKYYGAKIILTMHLSSYTCNTNILIKDTTLCDGKIRIRRCSECCYERLFNIPSLLSSPLTSMSILSEATGLTGIMKEGKATTLMMVPATIKRVKRELEELIVHVDQFVSLAQWYKEILLLNGVPADKITVVPPALVTTENKKDGRSSRPSGLPVKMVFIGRIQPTKGIHLIIQALRKFSAQQVTIDIYGKAEENDYYKQCLRDASDMPLIRWKGEIKREDVVGCLGQYDIFCLASTFSEMSPLVIQEAFAAGIPVLASRVYGNLEQVQHLYNGLIFEFNSSASLQEQVQRLIDTPAMIQEMKNNVKPPLDFDIVHKSYSRIYDLGITIKIDIRT